MRWGVNRCGLVLCLALLWSGCANPAPRGVGVVDSLDVRVQAETDGSARIVERILLRGDADGRVRFRRQVATTQADGLEFVGATLDGATIASGNSGFDVTAQRPNTLLFEWEPPTPVVKSHELVLTYRAVSAVAVTEPRARLTWPIVSAHRGYDISRVQVVFAVPAPMTTFGGTGMAEAGWSVVRTADGIAASRAPVVDAETATLVAAFDLDRRGVVDPAWERNRDRQREFFPAFVAAAIFFLVIGAGTLVILRLQYPRKGRAARKYAVTPGEVSDADRAAVVSGLRLTALVGGLVAIACAIVAATVLSFLGPWLQVIPGSMLFVSVVFLVSAPWFRR